MPNYFDYIAEEASYDVATPNSVYTEMDLAIAELNYYVQEGVGVKILIGIGIAAALGGLIALIIKLFSNKSGSSASAKTKKTKDAVQQAKSAGVEEIVVDLQQTSESNSNNVVEKATEETEKVVEVANQYNSFVEKYFDKVATFVEDFMKKYPDGEAPGGKMKDELMDFEDKILDDILEDFPKLRTLLGAKLKSGAKSNVRKIIEGDEKTIKKVEKSIEKYATKINIDEAIEFVNNTMNQCRTLLFDGKELSKNGKRLKTILEKGGEGQIAQEINSDRFDELTALVGSEINRAYTMISTNMDAVFNGCKDALSRLQTQQS